MPDARFFPPAGPFPLSHLAAAGGARLARDTDAARLVSNVAPLDAAGPDDICFLDNRSYLPQLMTSRAGCGIVEERYAAQAPAGMALLIAESPYLVYARVASEFHPRTEDDYIPLTPGESVHPTVAVGDGTVIGTGVVIGPGARIGARCKISPNVYIGRGVEIGDDCRIGAGASVRYALIGNRVTIFSGVRIGEAGFGFARSPKGAVTVPQVGRVIVHDGVEIGANTTIDRGAGPDTVIGAGTRIDNLVQIGHNVQIGQHCIIVAQTGIAGSTRLGNGVQVGGQAGIAGHLTIGDGAQIAARAGLMRDVEAGTTVAGVPGIPIKQFFRQTAALARLAEKKGSE